jgi:hypothetical protein
VIGETSRKYVRCPNLVGTLLVVILSFVVLLLAMPRDLGIYDEGIVLMDAMRVLSGDVIHRDFYSPYGPGQYYTVAALFHLFGEHFMVERLYDIAIRSVGIATLFFVIRLRCSLVCALLFTVIGGMWMMSLGSYLYPVFPCIPLALFGSYLVTRVGAGPVGLPWLVAAGACTGLAALFRYDVGFLILIAHIASIAVLIFLAEPAGERIRHWLKATAVYGAGVALMFFPAAILILSNSALEGFLADIVYYPTKYYARMRELPFPLRYAILHDPAEAVVYLPLLATGLSVLELFRLRIRPQDNVSPDVRLREQHMTAYLIVFGSLSAMLFLKGAVRVGPTQMLLGIMPGLAVIAVVANGWWQRQTVMRITAAVAVTVALLPAISALKSELSQSLRIPDRSVAGWLSLRAALFTMPRNAAEACETAPAAGFAKLGPDYARVANYLDANGRNDKRIFVALDRHDKIFINAPGLYFAVNKLPGTHWAQFDPGLQTRADIQSAIISDLAQDSVRWVVRDGNFDQVNEPNGSAQSSGIKLLDNYIDHNYRAVTSSGKVSIWLAVNQRAPPGSARCTADPPR